MNYLEGEMTSQESQNGPAGTDAVKAGKNVNTEKSGKAEKAVKNKKAGETPGGKGIFRKVHALVRRIPSGRVMTYGDIAAELGSVISPLAVGWALSKCPDDVPWQRVINAGGKCSTDEMPGFPRGRQVALLADEGVIVDEVGCIDLDRYRWRP
jgi:methylated-DNA-protein-cysteine methyltransferase-like protein